MASCLPLARELRGLVIPALARRIVGAGRRVRRARRYRPHERRTWSVLADDGRRLTIFADPRRHARGLCAPVAALLGARCSVNASASASPAHIACSRSASSTLRRSWRDSDASGGLSASLATPPVGWPRRAAATNISFIVAWAITRVASVSLETADVTADPTRCRLRYGLPISQPDQAQARVSINLAGWRAISGAAIATTLAAIVALLAQDGLFDAKTHTRPDGITTFGLGSRHLGVHRTNHHLHDPNVGEHEGGSAKRRAKPRGASHAREDRSN
jgi:hypothetical protein